MSQSELYFNYEGMWAHANKLKEIRQELEALSILNLDETELNGTTLRQDVEACILAIDELRHLSLDCIEIYEKAELDNIKLVSQLMDWEQLLKHTQQRENSMKPDKVLHNICKIHKLVEPAPVKMSVLISGNNMGVQIPVASWLRERI